LVTVGSAMSPAALSVATTVFAKVVVFGLMSVAATWLMEPPVDVTNKFIAVAAAALLAMIAGRTMLPPLVSVVFRVEVWVIVPAVIVPVAAGADSVRVELDEIAPVVIEPVEAVNVELEFVEIVPVVRLPVEAVIEKPVLVLLMLPVETVPPEIETEFPVESAPVVIVPLAAVMFNVAVWTAPVVMEPVVAVMFKFVAAVTAPRVMLPAEEVTDSVAPPLFLS